MIRFFSIVALAAICATPLYKTYRLNASVDHLRTAPDAAPFFAYFQYGIVPDTVIFNVTGSDCERVVDHVIPTFVSFVRTIEAVDPAEVRLAWRGTTIAIFERSTVEALWQPVSWETYAASEPLNRAIHCATTQLLVIDPDLLLEDPASLI